MTSFPPSAEQPFVKVQEIMDNACRFGIPHFQRGQVWSSSDRNRLIESLLEGYPCGAIILWRPPGDLMDFGTVFGAGAEASKIDYLILDGQQRISTLLALRHYQEDENHRGDEVDFPSNELLKILAARPEVVPETKFQVIVVEFDLAQAVHLYNRINSSGVVVRSEEKAFAAMVSIFPEAGTWLGGVFEIVHGKSDTTRNDWLQRKRERNFGFALFVRALVQTVGYHCNDPALDFSILHEKVWQERLRENPQELPRILEEARAAIVTVATAIKAHLHCDDFRFAPPIAAVRLVVQLLLKYPEAGTRLPSLVPGLLLRLSLVQTDEMLRVFQEAMQRSIRFGDVVEALPRPSNEEIQETLRTSRSWNSTASFVLYWLLRRCKAEDLLKPGQVVDATSAPQADHIVAYAKLKGAYGLGERRNRPGRHEIHGLGNITWIPGSSNWNKGAEYLPLSEFPEDLLRPHFLLEPEQGRETSHLLRLYNELEEVTKWESKNPEIVKKGFEEFKEKRLDLIVQSILEWVQNLDWKRDDEYLGICGLEPAKRRVVSSRLDMVRDMAQEKSWSRDFKQVFLELTVRGPTWSGGKNYTDLLRLGHGVARKTDGAHTIRLHKMGEKVKVGSKVAGREKLCERLSHWLGMPNEAGWHKLDPKERSSVEGLRLLSEFLGEVQG
jgi:hypothetical protein